MDNGERRRRVLTDEDVRALVDELETRVVARLDRGLGQGVRAFLWRVVLWAALAAVAYGVAKGVRP